MKRCWGNAAHLTEAGDSFQYFGNIFCCLVEDSEYLNILLPDQTSQSQESPAVLSCFRYLESTIRHCLIIGGSIEQAVSTDKPTKQSTGFFLNRTWGQRRLALTLAIVLQHSQVPTLTSLVYTD